MVVEPGRGVDELTRMRRPNLSTLGSSDDQARFSTDGRCGGCRLDEGVARADSVLRAGIVLAETMALAAW